METIKSRIKNKIEYSDDGCWNWTGRLNAVGNPLITSEKTVDGVRQVTTYHVRRFLYEDAYGKCDVRYLDTSCDNERCVNPSHVLPRTLENVLKKYKVNGNGCWVWQGYFRPNGYGSITIDGKSHSAHRVSYEFHNKQEIPDGLFVLHSCNNKKCINPSHLRLGTHAENMVDMANSDVMKGENNPKSILTREQVVEIKRLIRSELVVYRKIAEMFGVSRQAIKDIAIGRTWNWVD